MTRANAKRAMLASFHSKVVRYCMYHREDAWITCMCGERSIVSVRAAINGYNAVVPWIK